MNNDVQRPDPDALLARLEAESIQQRRGKLKIFFGASPGVGKTHAMLAAARSLQAQGVDLVIGVVETHGRSETAEMVRGLELIAPQRIEYKGHELREFDIDAALARKPELILVDELAQGNHFLAEEHTLIGRGFPKARQPLEAGDGEQQQTENDQIQFVEEIQEALHIGQERNEFSAVPFLE